ncbi:MAG: zf-HC2 domain-containing protein [Clostridium sp.]
MTCQEAERMVTPYINDELTGDEIETFLNHLEECKDCQEELEIYFMVDVGLKQLDHGSGTFDIAGSLERKIEESYGRVSRMWGLRILKYAVTTLASMTLIVIVALQFRIWLF